MSDCEEIQELWIPKVGDIIAHRDSHKVESNPLHKALVSWDNNKESLIPIAVTWVGRNKMYIWLPHQDQLQEMVEAVDTSPYKLHLALTRWLEIEVGLPPPYDSMEQLWLAFVMKERHNKTWDGDNWIDYP